MSDAEDKTACQACSDFEPQTWRKSLCKNCFHTLDEHSAELLANEAKVVAKEKAAAKLPDTSTEHKEEKLGDSKLKEKDTSDRAVKGQEVDQHATSEKGAFPKKVQRKYGAERAAAEGSSAWSWAKDLGQEFGKPAKPTAQDTTKATSSAPSTTATVSTTKLSPLTSVKPSAKSSTGVAAEVSISSPSSSLSSSATSSSSAVSSDTTSTSMSKTKNFASKFESKVSALSKSKPSSKPPDIRPGSSNVALLTGKLTDSASVTKTQPKQLLDKPTDPQTTPVSKVDSTETKRDTTLKSSKPVPITAKDNKTLEDNADNSKKSNDFKDKKSSLLTSKVEDKSSKLLSKAAPFGKDILRSTKDPVRRDNTTVGLMGKSDTSSTGSVKKTESSSDSSIRKTESATLSSVGKTESVLVDTKEVCSLSKKEETTKGEVLIKSTSPGDSSSSLSEKDKSADSISEKYDKWNKPEGGPAPKTAETKSPVEVGESTLANETSLETKRLCSPRDSVHAEESTINNTGHEAKSTGRNRSYVETGRDSDGKESNRAIEDNDDVVGEGHNGEGEAWSSPSDSKVTDVASISTGPDREQESSEVGGIEQKCDTTTSISSSPSGREAITTPVITSTSQSTTLSETINDSSSALLISGTTTELDVKSQDLPTGADQENQAVPCFNDKSEDLEKVNEEIADNESSIVSVKSSSSLPVIASKTKDESPDNERKDAKERTPEEVGDESAEKLSKKLQDKDERLSSLAKQLSAMEEEVRILQEEKDRLKKVSLQSQKEDLEKLLNELRSQLSKMEERCSRLEKDNQSLIDKLHLQEASVKRDQECRGKTSDNIVLEEDLEAAEKELEDVKEENKELQRLIMEMKNEMDEMYDHFRENEHDEFRELQKELDMTGKNCRILQFKLRKAERRNEQIEQDRVQYEEKLRMLQDQFDSQDAKNHIRVLEDELRMAKEVSVRLHDELDIVEDKRNKALEENRHLTELLEHTDKRQFRMEMEIDKLRDVVSDLKQQLKEAKGGNNKETTPDRKPPLGAIGKQGSREYDVSQLMKDLYDSMERENDLKDQLKFTEEEAKMMRRRVSEMDEENENLRLQLQKMSEKASKHKKKEKERLKELEEEKKHSEAYRAALSAQTSQDDDDNGEMSSDVILIVGPEGSDVISSDELVHVSQRKDSTDEDLMNVLQMRVQLEMLEHELMTSHQKLDEMDLEHENQQAEIKFLQERLAEKETNLGLPEPTTPNAYYEDKLKEISQEVDELRWKLIEKDRELERLSVVQTRHIREHSHKKGDKLMKSRSLEEADGMQVDLRKQLEQAHVDISRLKKAVEEFTAQNKELRDENEEYKNRTPVPSVHADDAAIENIELKENVKKLEETNRQQTEKIKCLTENLQKLARDTRTYTSIATSPTVPGTISILGIPFVGPGTQTARASVELPNPRDDSNTRDLRAQLHVLQSENEQLRRLMEELAATGEKNRDSTPTHSAAAFTHKPVSSLKATSISGTEKKEVTETFIKKTGDLSATRFKRDGEISEIRTELNANEGKIDSKLSALSTVDSSQSRMDSKKESTSSPAVAATSVKNTGGKTKESSDGDGRGKPGKEDESAEKDRASKSKETSKDEPLRSILLEYPEGKSKVIISGSESRVELMEKVLEMDEEIGDLLSMMRKRDEEAERLRRDVKYLNTQLRQLKDESRRTELDLLQELDMLHDKNSVMSNLLDIINERAEAAEEELERRMQEEPTHSPTRSASNVSQVSALSDTSVGSDEVFLTAFVSKEGVITRDWESKLKGRIESLERLLAEERQKVTMAEKKLILAGIDSVSPSVSDDVKLRIREKELLQEELLKSQRHLHIATDQIQGLKERVHILEDEHTRLKADYARLYDEIDKPLDKDSGSQNDTASEKNSDEPPFVAKRISVVEAPKFRELKQLANDTNGTSEKVSKLEEELARYKQIAKELEYKVEEIDDIWRSKSSASDKERDELEKQLNLRVQEITLLEAAIDNLKMENKAKEVVIAESNTTLREKQQEISRLAEIIESRDGEKKKYEQERENLLGQISQRDTTIRGLNDTIRIRDERLKEKDDILFKLNTSIEEQKREMKTLTEKLTRLAGQLKEQEVQLSNHRGQGSSTSVLVKDMPRGCQTDAEKESFRLKETVKKLQGELEKVVGDKRTLEFNLEKSRKSLDEAMLMWDKDRHSLQRDANILEEKVRLYEAFNSMNKDETIETLKVESQGYFNEKEALLCELSSLRLKHEADERLHKEVVAKLQAELTEKLRQLKMEVDSNSHITTEMNRLKRQAEMAYRLQQEQRVFKAEHLAMKVRYETRIDKLSKEHNKMMLTIDKLQKERDMDKQIIDSIQKNLNIVKDSYTEELLRSQEDKGTLRRYVKEIEESRLHLDELQRHIRELRDKTVDQDRLRSDLINKFATDRASWEIERANLNSQLNQLEEKIYSSCRQQERSKDIQVNMGMAWEKERREQQRLLCEAHSLALDLQEQLKSRDETFAHERKEMLCQMENERVMWTKEKREAEKEIMELKSASRRVIALEKKLKELQEKADKDAEAWHKEQADLLALAAETRHNQARDTKRLENVLSRLIRLRELGMMLTSQTKWDSLEEKPPDRQENTYQSIIDYVKEAVLQICQAADELTLVTNPASDEEAIKRISSSEIDLLKQQFSHLHHEADNVVVIADISTSSTTTKTRIEEESAGVSLKLPNVAIISVGPSQPHQTAQSETITKTTSRSVLSSPPSKSGSQLTKTIPSPSTTTQSSTIALRPNDALSRHYDRPPSYTSGTRSAQSSRAATPEAPDYSQRPFGAPSSRKLVFPEPSPGVSIPHHNIFQKQKHNLKSTPSGYSSNEQNVSKRPITFIKSLSVDSAPIIDSELSESHVTSPVTSISASNTPTHLVTSADIMSSFSTPSVITSSGDHYLSASRHQSISPNTERFSPRTARRLFFESYPASISSYPTSLGYQSWPERKSVPPALYVRQTSLPDPDEVRREAEEEHDLVSSKLESRGRYSVMKSSTSWDEQMLRKDVNQEESAGSTEVPLHTAPTDGASTSSTDETQTGSKHVTAKEKRRLFKKATSLDSTIGSSIAKVGVAAMPPGAPTGFTPSELFAAVKGKLKPAFKKKSAGSGSNPSEPRSPSPLFIQTEVPDIHFSGHGTMPLPVPAPHVDVDLLPSPDQPGTEEYVANLPDERSRDSQRSDVPRGKWRSKSADRAQGSLTVRTDIIRAPTGVWQFNETAV